MPYKNKIIGIYKIVSPSGKIYIGQSRDCMSRKSEHRRVRCKKQQRLYRSLKKYGWAAHKFEIIHYCTIDQLNYLEAEYVMMYNTFNTAHGLNLMPGGGHSVSLSEETKLKISIAGKGRKHSEQTKQNISKGLKGHKLTEETKNKISLSHIGKTVSKETREKYSILRMGNKYALGKKHAEGSKTKIPRYNGSNANAKMVIDMSTGEVYSSAKEVAIKIGVNYQAFKSKLNGANRNNTNFKYYNGVS